MLVKVVFNSDHQDVVDASGLGLFRAGEPRMVTADQAKVLLTNDNFSIVEDPPQKTQAVKIASQPQPPAAEPESGVLA